MRKLTHPALLDILALTLSLSSLLPPSTFLPTKGLDWNTQMSEARKTFGPKVTLQGNVDPMVLFGPEAAIRKAVEECVAEAGPGRHILNVGHGVAQGTPEENVKLFCDLARQSTYKAAAAR